MYNILYTPFPFPLPYKVLITAITRLLFFFLLLGFNLYMFLDVLLYLIIYNINIFPHNAKL